MSPKQPDQSQALGSLLGALVGGHPAVKGHMDKTGQSLDQVLGSITGSQSSGGGQSSSGAGDLLGALLGGSSASAQGGALGQVLGGLLGGAASQGRSGGTGADAIGSLLGGLVGFDPSQGASGLANNPIANTFIQPIADALARKTGMAPGIARVVVVFALTVLVGAGSKELQKKGFNSSDLVNRLATDGSVPVKYLKDTGLVSELAQQSGLDQQTAAKSLQQAFTALGTHVGGDSPDAQKAQLQSLIKSWK
jgi:hypothetical protein